MFYVQVAPPFDTSAKASFPAPLLLIAPAPESGSANMEDLNQRNSHEELRQPAPLNELESLQNCWHCCFTRWGLLHLVNFAYFTPTTPPVNQLTFGQSQFLLHLFYQSIATRNLSITVHSLDSIFHSACRRHCPLPCIVHQPWQHMNIQSFD